MLSLGRFGYGRKHPSSKGGPLVSLGHRDSELARHRYIDPPIAGRAAARQDLAMSLNLQNDVAWRLGYGGPRQAVIASALFGHSCRLLEPTVGDRRKRVVGHRAEPQSSDKV
jgi:hypothetical protein